MPFTVAVEMLPVPSREAHRGLPVAQACRK